MNDDKIDGLIAACPKNMSALEELYLIFKRDVILLARSIVKSKESTEDVLQETFIRLRKAADKYRPCGKGKGYILKIAYNVAHEIYRKNRRTANLDAAMDIENPINEFARAEAAIMVGELMKYLNDDEKEFLALRYFSDLTLDDVAHVLGKTKSSVQWRLEKIFYKLRAHGIDIEVD